VSWLVGSLSCGVSLRKKTGHSERSERTNKPRELKLKLKRTTKMLEQGGLEPASHAERCCELLRQAVPYRSTTGPMLKYNGDTSRAG